MIPIVVEQGDDLSTFCGGSLMKHSAVFLTKRIVDLNYFGTSRFFLLLLQLSTNLCTHIYVHIFFIFRIYIQNIWIFYFFSDGWMLLFGMLELA